MPTPTASSPAPNRSADSFRTAPDVALPVAREVAAACSDVLMASFGTIAARSKEGGVSHDLVTDADVASERAAAAILRERFPNHAILGEENAASPPPSDPAAEPSLWIIDPLDGTTNYAHGLPHFAVSIAYYERGRPVAAIVANPARGERYEATVGGGATRHDGKGSRPLRVAEANSLDAVLVGCGFYYDRGPMMQATLAAIEETFGHGIHGIRRMGTASLDLCQVASGQFGVFFEYKLQPWDYAAGRLIVTEAGGRVSTCEGGDIPVEATSFLATNGRLHDAMLAIVRRHATAAAPAT